MKAPSNSELQDHIDAIMQGFRSADSEFGTAGHEVVEAMRQSFRRLRPEKRFQTLRQYLEFRHDNVGAESVAHGLIRALELLTYSSATCLQQ